MEGRQGATHASHYEQEVVRVRLGDTTGRIHLVHDEGDVAGAHLFDEQMAEEVVVPGEVAHVHDLGWPPLPLE